MKQVLLSPKAVIIAGVVIFLALAAIPSLYFYNKYQEAQKVLTARSNQSSDETTQLVNEVGKLMVLPSGTPTVATVTDITKLKNQSFFQNAQNGDKVLIYNSAKEAILYNPQVNKIVNVAPVNIGSQSAQQITPARIVLENGTNTYQLDSKVELNINKAFPQMSVVSKVNAQNNYDKTLVVPLNSGYQESAQNIANLLKGQVGTLPKGESEPKNADIVVFVGKDQV